MYNDKLVYKAYIWVLFGIIVFGKRSFNGFADFFQALPVVFYFGAVTNLAYYVGLMQYIIKKIGWLIQLVLNTGIIESFVAAANIFLGVVSTHDITNMISIFLFSISNVTHIVETFTNYIGRLHQC